MLELVKRNIVEFPFEVLEQAHWRPAEAQLCCKHKPEDVPGPEYQRLRNLWRRREVNCNFAMELLLLSLSPSELSQFAISLSESDFSDTFLYGGYCQQLKKIIGVPDLILGDGKNCILGEIKIEAHFEITQFIKYQTFAILCRATAGLPNNLLNVLIVQNPDPSVFLSDFGRAWSPTITNSELILSDEEKDKIEQEMRGNVLKLSEKLKLSSESIRLSTKSLESQMGEIIPTKVFSWPEFVNKFDVSSDRTDLMAASRALLKLGTGTFDIEMSC